MSREWKQALGVLVLALGCAWGRWLGHREMKHWQDEWYAAHPVVKEGSCPPDNEYHRGWHDGLVGKWQPEKKAAPIKDELLDWCQKAGGRWQYFEDKGEWLCANVAPPPPKPTKGSKRLKEYSGYLSGFIDGANSASWAKDVSLQESSFKHVIKGMKLKGTCMFSGTLLAYNLMKETSDGPCEIMGTFDWDSDDDAQPAPQPAEPNQQ